MTALTATYLVGIILLSALNYLAYWRGNPVLFMIVAGISMMLGLYSPDALSALGYSTFGISIGLMLIFYSFVNIGLAYNNLFNNKNLNKEDEG